MRYADAGFDNGDGRTRAARTLAGGRGDQRPRAFSRAAAVTSTARALALAALLLLAGSAARAQAPPAAESPQARLLRLAGESRTRGSADATVLVYEIADFQCPFCARFAIDVFPHIDSAYVRTGKVQWVFVNLPMPSHPQAWGAAEAALCAGAVANRFWLMHDRLFVAGQEWISAPDPTVVFMRYAREYNLPLDAFQACLAQDRVAPVILQDVIFASRVSGTPTFVVTVGTDRQTIVGVKSFAEWREVLDTALRKK
ncbi:MAG TPA: thioredoxin domain-containing protein [Longimicrobiales bacterium]|nr:thioredoxin domain-containing protein [Longimicrobiales bacterium]